jgi:aconitase A
MFGNLIFPQELPAIEAIEEARVLLYLGDSVTTDHISPAGSIARNSPAARYLAARGYVLLDLNIAVPENLIIQESYFHTLLAVSHETCA